MRQAKVDNVRTCMQHAQQSPNGEAKDEPSGRSDHRVRCITEERHGVGIISGQRALSKVAISDSKVMCGRSCSLNSWHVQQ